MTTSVVSSTIVDPFWRVAERVPDALALTVDEVEYSYGELHCRAEEVAGWLLSEPAATVRRVAVLASRSIEAYMGVLGSVWAGAAYIPINPSLPPARIARILELSTPDALIVDASGLRLLVPEVLAHAPRRILAPGQPASTRIEGVEIATGEYRGSTATPLPVVRKADDPAYVIFTSGTTGTPKGVVVSHGNVAAYLAAMNQRYPLGPQDRVSQSVELSFDPSVGDMFWTWGAGASLHVVPTAEVMAPDNFIKRHALTVWSSVPSTVSILARLRRLKPGVFPSLRYSIFGGEPVAPDIVRAWQQSAPSTIVDILYGPTEATIACTGYVVSDPPLITPERQILSIGRSFPGTNAGILSPSREFLPTGSVGELAVSGPQLALGYLNDPEKTSAQFPTIDGIRWYLTGDLAYQDSAGMFHCLGRVDNQVKVMGHRVELEEVDCHLREASNGGNAAAVTWSNDGGKTRVLVGFVCDAQLSPEEIQNRMRERVPEYMMPSRIVTLEEFPLTANGKVDRRGLQQILETNEAHQGKAVTP
jgi:D-alanine--poly(phosphoribitol) ligase subunit 1